MKESTFISIGTKRTQSTKGFAGIVSSCSEISAISRIDDCPCHSLLFSISGRSASLKRIVKRTVFPLYSQAQTSTSMVWFGIRYTVYGISLSHMRGLDGDQEDNVVLPQRVPLLPHLHAVEVGQVKAHLRQHLHARTKPEVAYTRGR